MQQHRDKYIIGSEGGLSNRQLQQIVDSVKKPSGKATGTLGGRAAVAHLDLVDRGRVVVKHYTRGGLIRAVNYNTYVKTGEYRCKEEFDVLSTLFKAGVSVPEPIAYVAKGSLLYNCWIVTREIEKARTLVDFSTAEKHKISNIIEHLQQQIEKLIKLKIHHVDLHPGNVLIGADDKLFIIDFDKARTFSGPSKELHKKYISRWQRAVIKHQLNEKLSLSV